MASPPDFSSENHSAVILSAPLVPPRKQPPGQPWSHIETVSLIDAYEEKWTAVRRGQLKAQQWEEVAASVAERCAAAGYGNVGQSKTGTQCRHKIEKLRKRYRAERTRPVASLWPFFGRMERLERGPIPISSSSYSARPAAIDLQDDEEEEEEEEEERLASNTKSINGIVRDGGFGFGRAPPVLPPPRKRGGYEIMQLQRTAAAVNEQDEEEEGDEEEEVEDQRNLSCNNGEGVMSVLAMALRRFGEGIVRIEQRRMELRMEMERDWMEMEARRSEMVMEAQRRLMEGLSAALGEQRIHKKARREHGSSLQ